jgi:hypothetical protein
MSGFAENTAHDASEKPERRETVIHLGVACRMLPLVRQIVDDVLADRRRLNQLRPEQERLDRQRRTLAWPDRARRYQIQEELAAAQKHLQEALEELEGLGIELLDARDGRVGFPTLVNNTRAYFSWRPSEEGLHYWHFAGETLRRPIPVAWRKTAEASFLGKS